jgi:hypothetical protein
MHRIWKPLPVTTSFSPGPCQCLHLKTMSPGPSDVYVRQLLPQRYGYPLFIPEPNENLPLEYRQIGISIGDVGIIMPDGSFSFLFNICAPADDPVHCYGVPDGFKSVHPTPLDVSYFSNCLPPQSVICSHSIKIESFAFTEGAIVKNKYASTSDDAYLLYNLSPPAIVSPSRVRVWKQPFLSCLKELLVRILNPLQHFVAMLSNTRYSGINLPTTFWVEMLPMALFVSSLDGISLRHGPLLLLILTQKQSL